MSATRHQQELFFERLRQAVVEVVNDAQTRLIVERFYGYRIEVIVRKKLNGDRPAAGEGVVHETPR